MLTVHVTPTLILILMGPYPTPNPRPNHYPHSELFVVGDIIAGAIVAGANVESPFDLFS